MNKMSFLPKFIRIKLIRQNIRISMPPENFQVNIAATKEELEKAYSLLHDCYVATKLMAPDISGLRCNFFSFLPSTTTVVAKIGETVVGTVALIKDSPVGLPSDKDFKFENDLLRMEGHELVEVSSLAIDSKFRKKAHVVSLYLMKYLQHYTTQRMGCTTVTCVVHPRARDFYEAFWGFKANKKIIKYKFVNEALGVHVFGKITDESVKALASSFPSQPDKNPISFLFRRDDFLTYPQRKIENHLDPIYTPQLLKYFMAERTQACQHLSPSELLTIYCAYSPFFDKLEDMDFFKNLDSTHTKKRLFRFPAKIPATLRNETTQSSGYIMDLSPNGAFLATELKLELNEEYKIEFELGLYKFSFQVRTCWRNRRTRNHQLEGYGIQFMQTQLNIARMLRQTHLGSVSKIAK